jgi:hypothetical protein
MTPNPLRTEREAFRFLLYVLAVFAVAMVIALVIQAL